MSRDVKTAGIILRKVNFRETSIILNILTPDLGIITVMAKGVRKQKSKSIGLLELLNELDLELYSNPNSEWYIYKSARIKNNHLFNIDHRTSILMQAAVEMIRQIMISIEDSQEIYNLLSTYLDYIKSVNKNGIAILWRFILKLCRILGIEFSLKNCVQCSEYKYFKVYFPQKNGFICNDCYHPGYYEQVIEIDIATAELISKLNDIGKYLDEVSITKSTIKQLNRIFLIHLSEHFHKKIHLKSIELL